MKKTLLAIAAALAASVISSQAQVYSKNIVGYANLVLPASSYSLLSMTFSNSVNTADQVFPNAQGGDQILIFNNSGQFDTYTYGFDINTFNVDWQPSAPNLPAGAAFFYYTGGAVAETNTFAGTVVLTNTVSFPDSHYVMAASVTPIAGGVDNTNIAVPVTGSGEQVLVWNGTSYDTYVYGFDINTFTTDWQPSVPQIKVGQGFFYYNNSGSTETWNQNVVVQ